MRYEKIEFENVVQIRKRTKIKIKCTLATIGFI
jgi:hypothetical protein